MKVFAFLVTILMCTMVLALPSAGDVTKRLNLGDTKYAPMRLGDQIITNKINTIKCKYDFAVAGGSSAAAINLKSVDGASCAIPNKAVVVKAWIDVYTTLTSGGSATIAVGTGQSANDLKTATAVASFTGVMDGIPSFLAASAIKMTALRNPTMTIAASNLTAGAFNVFISYIISD